MSVVTVAEVREVCGVQSDIVDDTAVGGIISQVEEEVISYLGIYTTPTKVIDVIDGNNKSSIVVSKPYIWKVLELKVESNSIDTSNLFFNPKNGIVTIDNSTNPYYFMLGRSNVRIKYLSAFMEKSATPTELSEDVEAGDSVTITVDDNDYCSANDWLIIEGMEGKKEITKVVSIDDNEIVVDNLINDYDGGCLVTKISTHKLLKALILYDSAYAVGISAIGGSYTFATSYTMPEYSTTLGVPYPHFAKMVDTLKPKRENILMQLKNKLISIS